MKLELMAHVEPDLIDDGERVREFGEALFSEMVDDTFELDSRWRRDGDPTARIFERDEFWYGNLLMSGEAWPHQLPESLPFLGGEYVEIDEGVGAMAMRPGVVRAASTYLDSLNIEDLRGQNAQHFTEDAYMTVEDKLRLASETIVSLREFYDLAARGGKAVVKIGSVV